MLVQLGVDAFLGGLFEHVGADVKANDVCVSSSCQLFTYKSTAAAKIQDLDFFRIMSLSLGLLMNVFRNKLRIRETHFLIHALIV